MKPIKLLVSAFLVLPALGILLFGPRAGDTTPKDRVVVDYWEKWTGHEEAQMREIVDDFNASVGKDKGIFVRYISTSNVDQKTLISTAAGVPPDIAGMWDGNLCQFAALDALEPLDDLAKQYGIEAGYYKRVFWDSCHYRGKLYALISTPCSVALHYNKKIFQENAAALRAAGLDPDRPPKTIDELDKYSEVLTTLDPKGRILRAGHLPMEPGWYVNQVYHWFGGKIWDPATERFTLTSPEVVRAYEWVQSYSKRYGTSATSDFRSGQGNFDSPQNGFMAGSVVIEQQGPWMANFIYNLKPEMSTVKWTREVELTKTQEERPQNYQWAVAPFPSAVPGLENVTFCGFDTLTIPRGSKHKKEAFEFIAYVNRQDVMEKLNSLHCKPSPLEKVSEKFIRTHPNPYIQVFEDLARSPNGHAMPELPILPEVMEELGVVAQKLALLQAEPKEALAEAQERLQAKYDKFKLRQQARARQAGLAAERARP